MTKVKTSIYLPRETHDAIKRRAVDMHVTDTVAMELAIAAFLQSAGDDAIVTACPKCGRANYHCAHVDIVPVAQSQADFSGIAQRLTEIATEIKRYTRRRE